MSRYLKRVSNEKERRDEHTVYYMRRVVGTEVYGYNVAMSDRESEHRRYVAEKLRDARKKLAREVRIARCRLDARQMTLPAIDLVQA